MKKKVLGGCVIAIIALAAAFNVSINMNSSISLSTLSLANVEALADGESGGGKTCYNSVTSKEGSQVMYCPICDWVSGTDPWYSFSSTCS